MDKITIVKLKDMVNDFLKENNITVPIEDFSIDGSSMGFKFIYDNLDITVERELDINYSCSSNILDKKTDDLNYKYKIVLNNKTEKVIG